MTRERQESLWYRLHLLTGSTRGPVSGTIVIKPKRLPKALSYDVRYGVEADDHVDQSEEGTDSQSHSGRELCVPDSSVGEAGLYGIECFNVLHLRITSEGVM